MSSLAHSTEALRRADGRIQAFVRKFGRGHLYLAYHAAFPLALTADMAYRIWANFQRDEWGELLQIPWIAVADLLLSNLCEESGELYQMDLAVRDTLLGELMAHPGLGQPRLRQLAKFLEDYVDVEMRGTDPNQQLMAQTQRWVALAYQGRETADTTARNIAAAMKHNEQSPLEVARLSSLVQIIGQPLTEAGYENLVQYGQVAWTLMHGDEDGRSSVAASLITDSDIQIGDVTLSAPQAVTPPPPTPIQTDEMDEVATIDEQTETWGEMYGFRFWGEQEFKNSFSLPENRLQELIATLHNTLRQVTWGDNEPYRDGLRYRYGDQHLNEEQLRTDLVRLAINGWRVYDALLSQMAGDVDAAWDLADLMQHPGVVQISNRTESRLVIPVTFFYDYPLNDIFRLDEYRLCDTFITAVQRGQFLQETACFQGNCPQHDDDLTICPSGFWGFRHSLGLPLSSASAPDTPSTIPYSGTPKIAVSVSNDPNLVKRPQHEEALHSLGLVYNYADNRDEAVELMQSSQAQFFYFYCQGGTTNGVPYLSLGRGDEWFTPSTLRNSRIRWRDGRPLVFINGLHMEMAAQEQLELGRAFIETSQAAGVIGTEITTFEPLATAFAEEFLRQFMVEMRTAGEAMRGARLALLQQGNPLGLVYTLYALPGLHLVQQAEPVVSPESAAPRFIEPFDFSQLIQSKATEMPVNETALATIEAWRRNPEGERVFLVTGEERSGKTELAAQLAQQDFVSAYHFCTSGDQQTLDPLMFIESLAAQLGNRYEAYRQALLTAVRSARRPQQKTAQNVVSQAPIIDAEGEWRLNLSGLSLTEAFMTYITEPFHALFGSDFAGEVVLLLDGLNEAMTEVAGFSIPAVLAYFERVSPRLRWVVTARPLPEMMDTLRPLGVTEYTLASSIPVSPNYELQFRSQQEQVRLLEQIGERYNLAELQDLAFQLEIDYEELVGSTKSAKIRELVDMTEFQGRLGELVALLKQERPNLTWIELELKTGVPSYDLLSLHSRMMDSFLLAELQNLTFELRIDYEELPGSTKSAKIRGLIVTLAHQERLGELLTLLKLERPSVDWDALETVAGWAFAEYLNPYGTEAVVGEFGIRLQETPTREGMSIGLVRAGGTVTILGETEREYVRVQARLADVEDEGETAVPADMNLGRAEFELFVNRESELATFRQMLSFDTPTRIMVVEAPNNIGKSFLLRRLQAHCQDNQVAAVLIDFREQKAWNVAKMIMQIISQLGEQRFKKVREFISHLANQTNIYTSESELNIYIMNSLFARLPDERSKQALEIQLNEAFFEDLSNLNDAPVALFFDSFEDASPYGEQWIMQQLVRRLDERHINNVVVVIAGRRTPDLDFAKSIVAKTSLKPFTMEQVQEYFIEKRQLTDVDIETIYKASSGIPGLLATMADAAESNEKDNDLA